MSATIRFISNDKRNCKCSNGCLIRSFSGERFYQVYNANGKPRRGERYCQHCLKYAKMNNEDAVMEGEADTSETVDEEAGLRLREEYAAYQYAGCTSEFWSDRDAGLVG